MLLKHTNSTGANEIEAAREWAEELFAGAGNIGRAGTGTNQVSVASERIGDLQVENLILAWASETNRWICEYVLEDGVEAIQNNELGGKYYQGAVPIIKELIGKAAWRLAGLINFLSERKEAFEFSKDGRGEL